MTIDPDVRGIATHWGLDPQLLQAVVQAEGNIVAAVQCSIPSVQTREKALDVLARSCTHALCDFVRTSAPGSFIEFWRNRWAPLGAANDPHALNANWSVNVAQLSGWGAKTA